MGKREQPIMMLLRANDLTPLSALRERYAPLAAAYAAEERALVLEHLSVAGGSTRRAAATMGEHHTQVCRLIDQHGLREEVARIRENKKTTRQA